MDAVTNKIILKKLDSHELDIIVQVRKLGEGFDHKYLSVAAIFSVFSNLSPFVQFVGRVMRVIKQNAPNDILNRGVVVFHAGANVARRWSDFQEYSGADQDYFDQLLPIEELAPSDSQEQREVNPLPHPVSQVEVRTQSEVEIEEIPLIPEDELAAIRLLQERGRITGEIDRTRAVILQQIPTTKAFERQAKRNGLDARVKTVVGQALTKRDLNPGHYDLSKGNNRRTNFVVLKSKIDKKINESLGRSAGERHEFSKEDLDQIEKNFDSLIDASFQEVFNGKD